MLFWILQFTESRSGLGIGVLSPPARKSSLTPTWAGYIIDYSGPSQTLVIRSEATWLQPSVFAPTMSRWRPVQRSKRHQTLWAKKQVRPTMDGLYIAATWALWREDHILRGGFLWPNGRHRLVKSCSNYLACDVTSWVAGGLLRQEEQTRPSPKPSPCYHQLRPRSEFESSSLCRPPYTSQPVHARSEYPL